MNKDVNNTPENKPRRKRRTKAQIEADRAKEDALKGKLSSNTSTINKSKKESTKESKKDLASDKKVDIKNVVDNYIDVSDLSNNEKLSLVISNLSKAGADVNLDDGKAYSSVRQRIKFVRSVFGFDLKITSTIKELNSEYALVEARIYCWKGEQWELIQMANAHEQKTATTMNMTNYVETAETSAIGRALGFLGIFGDELTSADNLYNSLNGMKNNEKTSKVVRSKASAYKSNDFNILSNLNKNKILDILKSDSDIDESMVLNNKKDSNGNKLARIDDMSDSDAIEFISIYEASKKDDFDSAI